MRVPSYYCPNCKRFKKSWQVTNGEYDFGNCKHCGTACTHTLTLFTKFMEEYGKVETK